MRISSRIRPGLNPIAFIFLLVAATPVALGAQAAPKFESSTLSTRLPDTVALARDIPGFLEVADVPGLSIAVVHGGRVFWTGAFGTVNDSAQTPLNGETVFEAASMSKPVFGYIVLRLADRGEFDLDRPLFEMLEYPRLAHDERYKRITARMVLTHGTGLPNWGGEKLTLHFDPGTAYGYSGEAFVYLQKVIEHETGHSLEELARREVFQPLGMARSSFVWQERFAGNAAYARNWLWKVDPITQSPDANAAASLLTTATDYAQFVAAVLNGTGLSPEIRENFLTPARESDRGVFFGLGIGVEDGPAGRTFFHGGTNGNRFTSYMIGDLETGDGLVFLSSSMDGITLVSALADRVFRDNLPRRDLSVYNRHDEAAWLGLKAVQHEALESGADAATRKFRELRADPDTRFPVKNALWLGEILTRLDFVALGIEVFETAVADAPNSARAHLALGNALRTGGNHRAAIESYRRALILEPDNADVQRRIQWMEERLTALAPVVVSQRILESYVGQYDGRRVTMRDGRLFYQRGQNREHPLTPLSQDTFESDGHELFRLQFVGTGEGPAEKIVGTYSDGGTDESARSR